MLINQVTLFQLLEVNTLIKPVEDKATEISTSDKSDSKKSILLTDIYIEKATITASKLSDDTFPTVDALLNWYNSFLREFDIPLYGEWWKQYGLCDPILTHISPITFGQFIDAKMMVDAGIKSGSDKWRTVQYLMAIFLTDVYDDMHTYELSEQFINQGKKVLHTALIVSKWWDKLNEYINANYTVFQDSGDREENNENMSLHMERWGWVNFLKTIAKTKAFDISGSGMNSVDCVRKTKASEVLVWASEERDYGIAQSRDFKSISKGH
jgi:hypothetical protein